MKKYKRGRSKKGGYYLWADENDNEWVGTKLKNKISSFVPTFPNLNPLSYFGEKEQLIADAPVAVDYATADDAVDNSPVGAPVGQLEYPSYGADAGAMSSPMEVADVADADVAAADADVAAADADVAATDAAADADAAEKVGGRRRRRRRTTKKRKRINKRKRTMKRRRSMRRRR